MTTLTPANAIDTSSDGAVVDLYYANNLIGSAQLLDGVAYINNFANPVQINAGGNASFVVKIRSNTIITSAGDTNKKIRIGVLSPGSLGNGTTQTLISAVGNSISATGSFTDLIFNQNVLRKTRLLLTNNVINSKLSTVQGVSTSPIFFTTATADASSAANVYSMQFRVNKTADVSVSDYQIQVDNGGILYSNGADVAITVTPSGSTDIVKVTFSGSSFNKGLIV